MKKQAVLLLAPLILTLSLTGCTGQVTLNGAEKDLANRKSTETKDAITFPDDNPSVPDGKVAWEKMSCAECHGADGKGVSGKTEIDLTDVKWMRKQKPLEQYGFLTYGKDGTNHPILKDAATRRQIWDLVFYTRNLAVPALTDAEFATIDPVFGANCAVCHGKRGHGDGPLTKPIPGSATPPLEPLPANFHQYNRFYDREDDMLWDHIANGIAWEGMPNFLNKVDKAKSVTFNEEYIWGLVKYIRAFHSSNVGTLAADDKAGGGSQSKN